MQSAEEAAAAAAVETQNLMASIAGILQGTTAAVPSLPLGGPGGSPSRANSDGSGSGMGGLPPGLMMLPAGLGGFPINLNDPNLAQYLQLLPGLGAPGGLGMDASLAPFMLQGLTGQPGLSINLASLLAGTGVDIDTGGADLSGMGDPSRKNGGQAGNKRPADGSGGGPYKRERSEEGRGREQGKCHVDGCNIDLTGLSPYYQRYRTCDVHLKAPSIYKDGVQQRFCQQCGRFHELNEFDGNKRSCRARLHSHNQRRRKRTEEQMANQQAAENHAVNAASSIPNSMAQQQMPTLAQMGLGPHGLLGAGGNLSDLLSQAAVAESLLGGALDPNKMPKTGEPSYYDIAALLNSLSPGLLSGLGMPTDANAALQLLAGVGGNDALGQPLLDSLLKSAASAVPGPMGGDMGGGVDLQQQLALALAAGAAGVGDPNGMPDMGALAAAAAAAAHAADPHGHHQHQHLQHLHDMSGHQQHMGPGDGGM